MVQFDKSLLIYSLKHPQKMNEESPPAPKFNFMHEVGEQH